jgi:hypothetical protein
MQAGGQICRQVDESAIRVIAQSGGFGSDNLYS